MSGFASVVRDDSLENMSLLLSLLLDITTSFASEVTGDSLENLLEDSMRQI